MIRVIGLWLVGWTLCVTPVAADGDIYDGPIAIKPINHAAAAALGPAPDCLRLSTPVLSREWWNRDPGSRGPPAIAVKPIAPRPRVPDEPIIATWGDCVDRALQTYEQWHNLHDLQLATGSCQRRLEEQGAEDYAGAEPPVPLPASPRMGERRNIGCSWWPIGSDADRDCAAGAYRF